MNFRNSFSILFLLFPAFLVTAQPTSDSWNRYKSRVKYPEYILVRQTGFDERNGLLVESVDPEADSVAIMKMNRRMAEIRKERPTVALVLAGGGAKGASHVGVLRKLEEKGIPIDFITGTSMGGLVGGLYSLGYDAMQLDSLLRNADWDKIMSDNIPPTYYSYERRKNKETYFLNIPFHYSWSDWMDRVSPSKEMESANLVNNMQTIQSSLPEGYLYGLNVYNLLSSMSVGYQDTLDFSELPIPFFCVAADVVTMKEKNWTGGNFLEAMRSTMSIPVYFKPVRTDGMILIDGGTLNNFPSDLARAMGADIVIGVDLNTPNTYSDINNAVDVIRNSMDGAKNATYRAGIRNLDIHIKPDMSGYNMLSFGTEEINDIIDRGYEAASEHDAELDSVLIRLGQFKKPEISTNVNDIHNKKVIIDSFNFEGLNEEETLFYSDKVRMVPGQKYSSEDIEKTVALLYSSGAFNMVTYRLLGTEEPYKCVFVCEKGPVNNFRLGFRIDTQEAISLLVDLGIHTNRSIGSSFNVKAKLGFNPYLALEYKYVPTVGSAVGASLYSLYVLRESSDDIIIPNNFTEQFWRNEATVFFDTANLRHIIFRIGAKIVDTPYCQRTLSKSDSYRNFADWKSFYTYAFAKLRLNTLDDTYFPSKGVKLNADYDYLISGYSAVSDMHAKGESFLGLSVTAPIRLCDRFVLQPTLDARITSNGDCLDIYMNNRVGGLLPGRYYAHQIPFMGYNSCTDARSRLLVANLDLRCHIAGNHYLSLVGAVCETTDSFKELSKPVSAIGLQYGLKTLLGPVKANVNYSSLKNFGFYLSLGFDF